MYVQPYCLDINNIICMYLLNIVCMYLLISLVHFLALNFLVRLDLDVSRCRLIERCSFVSIKSFIWSRTIIDELLHGQKFEYFMVNSK